MQGTKVQGQISHALHHECSGGMTPAVNTEQQNVDVLELVGYDYYTVYHSGVDEEIRGMMG